MMSSSEEDDVRRPRRSADASRVHSPSFNEESPLLNGSADSPRDSDVVELNGDDDADLFGSGSDDEMEKRPHRSLDDEQLDSGDDEGRYDRPSSHIDEEGGEDAGYGETLNVMDLSLSRAPEPESSNGNIYAMTVPNFLSVETEEFRPETYVAPPYTTAATSICWRFDPKDLSRLQSNARIIRWEDGSLSLQLSSNPRDQHKISMKALAPLNKAGDYDPELDVHAYLGAAAETASVFRITSHLTHSLAVLPTSMETDDAVQRLRESLAAATRSGKKNPDGTVTVIDVKEDPELAKRQAETAEREKLRAARRRQALADRELDRGRRVGVPYRTGGAGLTVGGLEDDTMLTTRARPKKPRAHNRRGEIYTDSEDDYDRRGRTREDEYDENDGFLVGSDVEPEVMEDDDDEEELEDDELDAEGESDSEIRPEKPSRKERPESPKRKTIEVEMGGELGAGGGSPPTRKKPRYVVESDEDE